MIDTILFDLDDTILDFHRAEEFALRKTLEKLNIEPYESTIKRYSEINQAQWKLLELGKITRNQVLTGRFDILFDELGINQTGEKAWEIYENQISKGYFIIEGATKVLEELKNKYRLYIVSNGTATVQDNRIKGSDVGKYFDDIFISQRVGYNKPRVEFFTHCFEKIGNINRENTIIVGDSLSSDILGGINAGIHNCWYNPGKKINTSNIIPEYEISELSEIFKIIS